MANVANHDGQATSGDDPKSSAMDSLYQSAASPRLHHVIAEKTDTGSLLGTVKGVFLPCLQNILGVILFLRLPWIAGQAGIVSSILIVLICVLTTIPTTLSMSAIATNGRIPAGGPYYVVSRNLGPEFGGSIGLAFFFGAAIASSMYILGAVEALQDVAGIKDAFGFDRQIESVVLMSILAFIVYVGVNLVNKAALIFLVVVIVSIIAAVAGVIAYGAGAEFGSTDELARAGSDISWMPSYEKDPETGNTPDFLSLVALFYPSVTGIMAGSNRSGLLRDPSKAIPRGTLGAIFTTTLIYWIVIFLFGAFISNEVLKDNKLVVSTVAWPHSMLVGLGIIMSSVGAGMQSLVSASQLFKSIVDDDVIPFLRCLRTKTKSEAAADAQDEAAKKRKCCGKRKQPKADTSSQASDTTDPDAASPKSGPSTNSMEVTVDKEYEMARVRALSEGEDTPARHPGTVPSGPAALETEVADLEKGPAAAVEANVEADIPKGGNAGWKEVLATWIVATAPCLAGNLDIVTPILTEFFLMMYATVNLACFLNAVLKQPGFRPTWKYFHWSTALFGLLACIAVMIIVSWWAALAGVALMVILYKYIEIKGHEKQWGGSLKGLRLEQARSALLGLRGHTFVAKNWRPQLLILSKTDGEGAPVPPGLLALGAQLKKGKGLVIVGNVKRAPVTPITRDVNRALLRIEKTLCDRVTDMGIDGFAKVTVAEKIGNGLLSLIQSSGLGALEPTLVVMGWPKHWRDRPSWAVEYVDILKSVRVLGKGVLIMRGAENFPIVSERDIERGKDTAAKNKRTIDVWWIVHDGGLMLLLSVLLRRHRLWRFSRLRVFTVYSPGTGQTREAARAKVQNYLFRIRVPAEVHVVSVDNSVIEDAWRDRTLDMRAGRELLAKMRGESTSLSVALPKALTPDVRRSIFDIMSQMKRGEGQGGEAEEEKKPETVQENGKEEEEDDSTTDSSDDDEDSDSDSGSDSGEEEEEGSKDTAELNNVVIADVQSPDSGRPIDLGDSNEEQEGPAVVSHAVPGGETKRGAEADEEEEELNVEQEYSRPVLDVGTGEERLRIALQLNHLMKKFSGESDAVISNLPLTSHVAPTDFMEYVDALTDQLKSVILVRGVGRDVVSEYAQIGSIEPNTPAYRPCRGLYMDKHLRINAGHRTLNNHSQ